MHFAVIVSKLWLFPVIKKRIVIVGNRLNAGIEKEWEAERAKRRLLIRLIVLTNQTAKNSNLEVPSFPPSFFYLSFSI